MAAADEKPDELDKLFSRPESGLAPKPPGDFTRAFFGLEMEKPKNAAGTPACNSDPEPIPGADYPPPATSPGEFDRVFGPLNADAQPREAGSEKEAHYELQNGIPSSDPGTLTDLFAHQNQVPLKPLNPLSDTFTRLFSSEASSAEPVRSLTSDFTQPSRNAGSFPSPGNDSSTRLLPTMDAGATEKSLDEIGTGSTLFGNPVQERDPQKATRLFSAPKPTIDPVPPPGGPSPFTRVINSSALRSAEEKPDFIPPAINNPVPQPAQAASVPAPVVAPQWPVGNMPSPQIHPSAYLSQQPMPIPAVAPVSWPQAPSVPPAAAPYVQQPQIQPGEPSPQPAWIAYMPLIIGLNVLLFFTVVFILIFAMTR